MPDRTGRRPHPKSQEAHRLRSEARRGRLATITATASLLLLGTVGVVALAGRGGPSEAVSEAGSPAPDLDFALFDGTRTSFRAYQGAPVVLNFWASWCPACVAEMPDFEKVHVSYGERVSFVGIDTQDTSRSAAEELVHATGVSYQLGLDPTGVIFREFGGVAMPTTVFIDAAGNVVDVHAGALFADDLSARIDELFFTSG